MRPEIATEHTETAGSRAGARLLLAIAAEPGEFAGILARCRGVQHLNWPVWFARTGELNGNRLYLVANGPGPDLAGRAADAALARTTPDAVISTGCCGALDPALSAGDILVAHSVRDGETCYSASLPHSGTAVHRTGDLVSVSKVAGSVEEKARLASTGAAAVEMEAAAVARAAVRAGLPFYCIRVVLDRAGEGFELDFDALRSRDGRFSRIRIVRAALARPLTRVPELIRLARGARLAARALGDFFADCRF